MAYKSCPKCRKLTLHDPVPMNGQGKRGNVCTVCNNINYGLSERDRAAIEKKRKDMYPDDEKNFNEVMDKVSTQKIDTNEKE